MKKALPVATFGVKRSLSHQGSMVCNRLVVTGAEWPTGAGSRELHSCPLSKDNGESHKRQGPREDAQQNARVR